MFSAICHYPKISVNTQFLDNFRENNLYTVVYISVYIGPLNYSIPVHPIGPIGRNSTSNRSAKNPGVIGNKKIKPRTLETKRLSQEHWKQKD